MSTIIGRQAEIKFLDEIYHSHESELLAIYGRRRIGKTFLIRQFFKTKGLYFEITGNKDSDLAKDLFHFNLELANVFYRGELQPAAANWTVAFEQLRVAISQVTYSEKIILFFDELPWLAGKSDFLSALDYFWNRYASALDNIIVIICGSAAAWIIDNVINDKGGLHGRITRQIRLLPFSLAETEAFLHARHVMLNRKQIIELYIAVGGVAKYLTLMQPGKSTQQLISDTCFSPQGLLFTEFNRLYRSLFKNSENHVAIIKALAKNHSGLDRKTLLKQLGLSSGGTTSKILHELNESGFIAYISQFGEKSDLYRLIDEFSLFHLVWIAPAPNFSLKGVDKNYWVHKYNSQAYLSWAGFAFEGVCLKHIENIKAALGISGVNTKEYTWRYAGDQDTEGLQIDLVIDRADGCINLCEIKFYKDEFTLTRQYAEKLQRKKILFREITKTNKSLFTTLITTYGVKRNEYRLMAVDSELSIDALF